MDTNRNLQKIKTDSFMAPIYQTYNFCTISNACSWHHRNFLFPLDWKIPLHSSFIYKCRYIFTWSEKSTLKMVAIEIRCSIFFSNIRSDLKFYSLLKTLLSNKINNNNNEIFVPRIKTKTTRINMFNCFDFNTLHLQNAQYWWVFV